MNDGHWEIWQLPSGCLVYLHSRLGSLPAEPIQHTADKPAIMPFGKYRGAHLDIVLNDPAYAKWLLRQPWFGERYPMHRGCLSEALARRQADAEGPNAA